MSDKISVMLKISIGIAQYDGHPDYMRIIKEADDALYKAKSLGKNTYFLKPGMSPSQQKTKG